MTSDADVVAALAVDRRLVADFFETLDEEQLSTPSLCEAWTVREVLGHLVTGATGTLGGFALDVLRARGSVHRASVATAVRAARRPVDELTAELRHAGARVKRPTSDLADAAIHLRDCARPLGLADDVGLEHWRILLDWLPTTKAHIHVKLGTMDGLSFHASDQDWSWGDGPEVIGTSEVLTLGVTGRRVVLHELSGPGAGELARRLSIDDN